MAVTNPPHIPSRPSLPRGLRRAGRSAASLVVVLCTIALPTTSRAQQVVAPDAQQQPQVQQPDAAQPQGQDLLGIPEVDFTVPINATNLPSSMQEIGAECTVYDRAGINHLGSNAATAPVNNHTFNGQVNLSVDFGRQPTLVDGDHWELGYTCHLVYKTAGGGPYPVRPIMDFNADPSNTVAGPTAVSVQTWNVPVSPLAPAAGNR